jgi:NADH:ubiquinone oxidoreductase 49 kD subunit 7
MRSIPNLNSIFQPGRWGIPTIATWSGWKKCGSRHAIVTQAVEKIPAGPLMAKLSKIIKPPVGDIYHSIESPKGELGYYIVSDGSTMAYRARVRPPSFVNLQALKQMVAGHMVADVVAVIGTLDIVLGEIDR